MNHYTDVINDYDKKGYFPTFRGRKNRFCFYLTKLNSNIQLTLHKEIEEDLKSLKQTVSAALNNL